MTKKRIPYLDFIRFTAITGVVYGHISLQVTYLYGNLIENAILIAPQAIFRDGLPLLFMISGLLMLDKNRVLPVKVLFKKYILRLVIAIVVFVTFYDLVNIVVFSYSSKTIEQAWNLEALWQLDTYKNILINIFTMQLKAYDGHLWFIYVMLFIYILIPVLRIYVQKASKNVQLIVLIVGAIIFVFGVNYVSLYYTEIDLGLLSYVQFVIYFLSGYYIHNYLKITKTIKRIALVVFIIFTFINLSELLYFYFGIYEVDENWLISSVFIHSIATYILVSSWKFEFKFCQKMNKYMFGIYLIHVIYCSPRLVTFWGDAIVAAIFAFIIVYALSFATVWVGKKIPFIRSYVF